MTDPGVPTGDNGLRWTVDEYGDLVSPLGYGLTMGGLAQLWCEAEIVVYDDHNLLAQHVRDAARVPALEATADQAEQAWAIVALLATGPAPIVGESAGCPVCALCGGDAPAGVSYGVRHLDDCPWRKALDLLTEAPDGVH